MESIEPLGSKLRRQRRRLGLTLDELAGRAGISKPYLSLIETGRVPNPPSDEKLRRLEQTLGFPPNELISQAHLQRTPRDVRAMLGKLLKAKGEASAMNGANGAPEDHGANGTAGAKDGKKAAPGRGDEGARGATASQLARPSLRPSGLASGGSLSGGASAPINLDDAYMSGVLQELVDQSAGNVERVMTNAVPVVNRVSAGYPQDFTDLSYPARVADEYAACPDVHDRNAFGARVHGDSMAPKYREGDIVIFSPGATPRDGDDCFFRFDDGRTTFKRVFFETDDRARPVLRLQPRNEKYPPKVVASEKITGLWKAVFKYQRVDED